MERRTLSAVEVEMTPLEGKSGCNVSKNNAILPVAVIAGGMALLAALIFVFSFHPLPARQGVRYVAQRDSTDCGQACLAMLGYDGYGKDFWMSSPEVLSRACGVREIKPGSEWTEENAHMLVLEWPNGKQHWVIAWRDSIYDPSAGVWALTAFDERAVRREFVVPFAKVE